MGGPNGRLGEYAKSKNQKSKRKYISTTFKQEKKEEQKRVFATKKVTE